MATLTVDFVEPTPAPVNGYVVKYRKVGETVWSMVTPNPTSSPVVISDLDNTSYEGTVRSDCGSGITGLEVAFAVTVVTKYRLYGYSSSNRADACNIVDPLFGQPLTVYASTGNPFEVTKFFNDDLLIGGWPDVPVNGDYVSFSLASNPSSKYTGVMDTNGSITSIAVC